MPKTPHPVDLHVGRQARSRRQALAMSQGALGRRVGVTSQAVQKYEQGSARLSASRLYAMARALEVSPAYFFDGLTAEIDAAPETAAAPEAEALVQFYRAIRDPRLQAELLRLLSLLAAAAGPPRRG